MSDNFRKQLYRNFNQKATDELIEIWQANNHVAWSELTFDVIQEILLERLVDLPPQNEPITEAVDKEKLKEQAEGTKFNWMLPILGAIGFGIGFALMSGIMLTIYHHSIISISRAFGEKIDLDIIALGAVRGIFIGSVGGAGLGLAHKDKSQIFYLSLAGAIGFGWAFVLVVASDVIVSNIGWAIVDLIGKSAGFFSYSAELSKGSGMGSVVGGIGGLVLGLTLPKYRAIASFLLCLAGILSFSFVFVIGSYLFDGHFFSLWNAWSGIVGGISLGIALALYYKILDWIQQR